MRKGQLEAPIMVIVTYILVIAVGVYLFLFAVGEGLDRSDDIIEAHDTNMGAMLFLSYLNAPITFDYNGETKNMKMGELFSLYYEGRLKKSKDTGFYRSILRERTNEFFRGITVNTQWTVYEDTGNNEKLELASPLFVSDINLEDPSVYMIHRVSVYCFSLPVHGLDNPLKVEVVLGRIATFDASSLKNKFGVLNDIKLKLAIDDYNNLEDDEQLRIAMKEYEMLTTEKSLRFNC